MIESEKYLIPNNYKGLVTIYFNDPAGKEIKYENDARIYEIEANGELRTQFPPNIGIRPYDKMTFIYTSSNEEITIQHVSNISKNYSGIAVRGPYLTDYQTFIIVDQVQNLDNYPNPAIDENERKWE